jgi:hypothetical protein
MAIIKQPRFQLASHVYLCQLTGSAVLLDLKRDRYWGIEAAEFEALLPYMQGQVSLAMSTTGTIATEPDLLATLLAEGMLVDELQVGNPLCSPAVMRPRNALIEGYEEPTANPGLMDVVRFIFAAITVRISLKLHPLHRTIEAARIHLEGPGENSSSDLDAMRMRVAVYRRLRLFLFTAENACLFDSLVLARFLRLHGFFPRLVLGVKASPFAAHCWLQQKDTVINDTPEIVRNYTPIMAI